MLTDGQPRDSIYLNKDSDLTINWTGGAVRRERRHRSKHRQNKTGEASADGFSFRFRQQGRAKKRISFGDVQRLNRSVLPDGVGSREHAELLIDLDRDIPRTDPAWERWLARMIVDFVVWTERRPAS